MPSIRLERVAFAYPSSPPLLAAVDLHLTRGSTGVVGDNGAGKSTLLALVAGELAPTTGNQRDDFVVSWETSRTAPRAALVVISP